MNEFEFTIIVQTHNSELGIKKTIDSLINQTLSFKKNIEIIILDYNSTDKTSEICAEYTEKYPDNIKYFQHAPSNFHDAKNIGIENAGGKYISFLEIHDYYSKDTLKNILKFIGNNKDIDLISIPIVYFKNNKKWRYLNYKIKKSGKINLLEKPRYAQLLGLSTFIKKDSINDIRFLNSPNENITFFSEILMNNPNLGICKNGTYFSKNIDEKILPPDDAIINQSGYDSFIKKNFNSIIEKCLNKYKNIPQFIQFNLINHLRLLLAIKEASDKIDLTSLTEIIKLIDDDVILNNVLLKNENKIFSFLLKYDCRLNEHLKDKLFLNTVFVDIYNIIENKLYILASTFNESRDIDIYINGDKIGKEELRFPQKDECCLGYKYIKDYSIETTIPLNTDKTFKLEFKQNNQKLHIDFSRPCNFSKTVGYAKTKHYLSVLEDDEITIKKRTTSNWITQEVKSLIHIVKEHETGFEKAIPFRIAYMISYPFLKNKRIWFYMDRPDESDDNGFALFKYAVNKDKDIKKYFILSSKNKEFDNIKKIGDVLSYKSLKHRFLGMYVENIITSHPDNEVIYPFWGGYPFFAGLLKSNNNFLQHGLLKDNISSWLNKSKMDLSLFLVSAHDEYESIFEYPYNYDRNTVQMLGLPRFDTLEKKDDEKQIIIMPSWRRNLDHKSKEYVKENEFFKHFNSLINNERLISKAKEKNYKIIFRPHPKVYEYIDLFDENGYVKIDYDKTKYQTLFNSSSLMITDYSSVAFDFAYLYKPVIYYQYGSDYHFDVDESYFNYETMGFGEIVKTEDELVDLIIEYIENECKIKDEYYNRIDEFFVYHDKNNCKRAYDKIKEIPLKD